MPLFGPSHLIALGTIALVSFLCARAGRWMAWVLAGLLLLERGLVLSELLREEKWSLSMGLPMHLCDWAVISAVLALLFRWRLAYVLTYFWGLAGTVQALLTPDLAFDFPDLRFMTFFLAHGTIVVSVFHLTFATPLKPRTRDVWVAFGWTNLYAAVAIAVNLLVGANYGYLCAKPLHSSLLDYLGPWPWYVLSLEALALAAFWLCFSPFLLRGKGVIR